MRVRFNQSEARAPLDGIGLAVKLFPGDLIHAPYGPFDFFRGGIRPRLCDRLQDFRKRPIMIEGQPACQLLNLNVCHRVDFSSHISRFRGPRRFVAPAAQYCRRT